MASCSLQFTGDISLDRRLSKPDSQPRLSESARWLTHNLPDADIRVVNWESPLEGDEGEHEMDKPIVGTNPAASLSMLGFRIDVATIANNHIFDFKGSGVRNTIEFLEKNSVRTVGAGNSPSKAYEPLHLDVNGLPLTFLAYVGRDTNPPPEQDDMYVSVLEHEQALRTVRKWSNRGRKVIVSFHWGLEYEAYPNPKQRTFAREVIESGAMVVACHHAHRLQGHEQWRNGHIFYGLGNFIFGLEGDECWPFFTNSTAVACCTINDINVSDAKMIHLKQSEGSFSHSDPQESMDLEKRLNWPLKLSSRSYAKFWRLANIFHLIYEKPVEAFQRRGAEALLKINRDHLKSLAKALSFGKLKRRRKKSR